MRGPSIPLGSFSTVSSRRSTSKSIGRTQIAQLHSSYIAPAGSVRTFRKPHDSSLSLSPVTLLKRSFTLSSTRSKEDGKPNSHLSDTNSSGNPEFPTLSFETLGIKGPMKWLIVGILSIFGTIETWFWGKAIWRWWKADESSAEENGQAPASTVR